MVLMDLLKRIISSRRGRFGGLLVLVLLCAPAFLPEFWVMLLTEAVILALCALSWNLLLGYTGLLSFGVAAFYMVGAYVVAILTVKVGVPWPVALLLSPVISGILGVVLGWFCVRLTHMLFAIMTLVLGQLCWAIAFKWYSFTGGENGILGVPVPSYLLSTSNFYWFTLGVIGAAVIVMWLIVNSPFGYALKAMRENTERTEFIGINVRRYKLYVFILSSAFAGLAGGVFCMYARAAYPDYGWWLKTGEFIAMSLIGGVYHFLGPTLGALIVLFMDTYILTITEYWQLFFGAFLVLAILFFPGGIFGLAEQTINAFRERRAVSDSGNKGAE